MKFITWFWEFLRCSNEIHCLPPGLWSERLCSHFATMMSCLSLARSQLVNNQDPDRLHTRENTSEATHKWVYLAHVSRSVRTEVRAGTQAGTVRITVCCLSRGLSVASFAVRLRRSPSWGLALSTVGYACLYQLIIKTIPTDVPTGQSDPPTPQLRFLLM